MTTKSKKIVASNGDYAIEREEYWGFRCQTTSVSWNIYKEGVFTQSCARLRDAKGEVARRVAMDAEVDAASQFLSTVVLEDDARVIPLTEEEYRSLARAMQWPEDLVKWDHDHDTTPTNLAKILGSMTII